MAEIKIRNVDALGKPLGQYSHMTRVVGPGETLYIAGMLAAGDDFDAQCSGVFGQIETALKSAGAGWTPKAAEVPSTLITQANVDQFIKDHPDAIGK